MARADYDNDDRLEVLVAGCTDGTCTAHTAGIYRNNGGRTLAHPSPVAYGSG